MRILQVNKFNFNKGGADKYYLDLCRLLEAEGHQVAQFSMHHPQNEESDYSDYFVSNIDFNNLSFRDKLKTPFRIIYSLEAKKKFKRLVNDFKPDIIHIHNIYHQLSPSILDVARHKGIPVVMHLHDYKLISPDYKLFVRGQIWEGSKQRRYFQCLKDRCFKDSFWQSLLVSLEMTIHHKLLKIYEKSIDYYLAPSSFMRNKVTEFGINKDKVKVIVNPFSPSMTISREEDVKEEGYYLYFGRLSREKGLDLLIEAIKLTGFSLKIAGTGELESELKSLTEEGAVDIEFLGQKSQSELKSIILKSKAVIIPSIWYENMPLSMLEALNLGKAVIAANIGGLPEIVKPGENGLLFEAGNKEDLAKAITDLNSYDLKLMSAKAKESVKNLSPEHNLKEIIHIYQELIR